MTSRLRLPTRAARSVLAVALASLLVLLAGCGSASDLSTVRVEGSQDQPTLSFETPFKASETVRTVLSQGDGKPLEKGQKALVNYVGVNGRTGEVFDSSFERGAPTEFPLEDGKLVAGFITGLVGAPIGSRVLIAMPPKDGYPDGTPDGKIKAGDTILFLVDILSARDVLTHAEGEAVPPVPGSPTVTVDDKGVPSVQIPPGPPPAQPVIQPLITGTGPTVTAGQTVTAHFLSVRWSDGQVVDDSWSQGAPGSLQVGAGRLLPALDAALLDQPVGSRVLVVTTVPSSADQSGGEPSGSPSAPPTPAAGEQTFVFVIDILDATG